MTTPELMKKGPFETPTDEPAGRWFNMPESGRWEQPVLSEWELRAAHWTDCHPYDELNYVLEGELHVDSGGAEVVARAGDVVRVPAGSTGHYWTPTYARMVSIYGPNPDGLPTIDGDFRAHQA